MQATNLSSTNRTLTREQNSVRCSLIERVGSDKTAVHCCCTRNHKPDKCCFCCCAEHIRTAVASVRDRHRASCTRLDTLRRQACDPSRRQNRINWVHLCVPSHTTTSCLLPALRHQQIAAEWVPTNFNFPLIFLSFTVSCLGILGTGLPKEFPI